MSKLTDRRLAGATLFAVTLSLAAPAFALDEGANNSTPAAAPAVVAKAAPKGPSLSLARADIKAQNWSKAIADLKVFIAADNSSADAYNLLGYSYRNAGNFDLAGRAYAKALKLDPKHAGALEYQGILFIKLGQPDKAKANLALIKGICGTSCEEYTDLAKALG